MVTLCEWEVSAFNETDEIFELLVTAIGIGMICIETINGEDYIGLEED